MSEFPEAPPVILQVNATPSVNLVRKVFPFPELAKITEERGREGKCCLLSAWKDVTGTMLGALYR